MQSFSSSSAVASRNRIALWALLVGPIALLVLFLVVPIGSLLRSSFYEGTGPLGAGFSLEQYARFLGDSYYLSVLAETIGFGLASAVVSLVIGYPVGYSLARLPPEQRRWRLRAVFVPLCLSMGEVAFGWLGELGRAGRLSSISLCLAQDRSRQPSARTPRPT